MDADEALPPVKRGAPPHRTSGRAAPLLLGATAVLWSACQTITLEVPAVNNPILLGNRLHVGGTPEYQASATGERYQGQSAHQFMAVSSQYSTSSRHDWERSVEANAKWAFQGTVRRCVRDGIVDGKLFVVNALFAIVATESLVLSGDIVVVDPAEDEPAPGEAAAKTAELETGAAPAPTGGP